MAYSWTATPSVITTTNYVTSGSVTKPLFFYWDPEEGRIYWDTTSCDPCAHPYQVPINANPFADNDGNIYI